MAKTSIVQRIKNWLTGGSKSTKSSGSKSTASSSQPKKKKKKSEEVVERQTERFNKRELVNNVRNTTVKEEPPKQEEAKPDYKEKFKATTRTYKSMSGKDSGLADALNEKTDRLEKIKESNKQASASSANNSKKKPIADPKRKAAEESRERLQKRLDALKTEREEFHKATNNKYNTKTGDEEHDRKAYALRVGGYGHSSPEVQKHSVEYHPTITTGARALSKGVTGGATEFAISRLSKKDKERAEAEKYYQEHKDKKAELAGEIAGSLAFFGGTGGLTDALGGKLVEKAAPRAAEKLAETKLIQGAAKRSVKKAVEKGAVKEASEELIRQVGKDKAKKIVRAVGNDIAQNATTGLLYDFNQASAEHEIGSADWWKEMGKSAAFNAAITGGIAGGSALTGNKKLVRGAADTVAENIARRTAARESGEAFGEEAVEQVLKSKPPIKNADEAVETVAKQVPPKRKPTKSESLREELRAERQALQDRFETAKKAGENTDDIVADMQETDLRLQDLDRKIAKADKARETRAANKAKNSASNEQLNLEDEIANSAKNEQASSKSAKQKRLDEAAERDMYDNVQRKREAYMADKIRKETGGEYAYRQGEHLSTANAGIDEARRIEYDQKAVYDKLKKNGVKDLFEKEGHFGVYKTANKEELNRLAGDAAKRVREDMHGTVKKLLDLNERLLGETDKSALASAEHVTFDDIASITAIEQAFEEAQEKLPSHVAEAFSHILEWQGTEAGQMVKMRDIFLKENSKAYRHKLISRDVDNWLRKALNADDKSIAELKRSLDKNFGEGYYDKMVEKLSDFKGVEREAEFKKAYAQFQKELIENSKPTGWDIVNVIRHTMMLMAPKTGGNNALGNINQRVMYDVADLMNIPLEKLAKGINPDAKRTSAILKNSDQLRLANMITSGKVGGVNTKNAKYLSGFKDQAFADAINIASDADVADMMESSKYMGEAIKGWKYKAPTVGGKVKQGAVKIGGYGQKFVSLMLNEPDSWFVERNYRSSLLKYLEANGINSSDALKTDAGQKLFKEAREHAKDVALENTYKKSNELVSFVEGLRKKGYAKGSNPLYKFITITLDAELPYLKVPVNLVVNNVKYSPMGLTKGTYDAFRALTKGDAELLNKATRELSKGLTGTGLMYLGYLMRCKNQSDEDSVGLVGNAEDSLKEYGIKDNSFKVGNHVFNISNTGIGTVQLLMGATLGEDLDKEGIVAPYQVVFDAMKKTLDVEASMSLMENATGLLDIFGNGGDYNMDFSDRVGKASTEIAGDYAAQFIPNPARGIAKGITDADLDTGVNKGDTNQTQRIIQRNINNVVSGVPILNEKVLPHKVDSHGRLVNERSTGREKGLAVLNNTLNPLTHSKFSIPEADREELKVTKDNGEPYKVKGFDPNRKYQAQIGTGDNAEVVKLTGKDREQVARSVQNAGYDGTMNLVNKGMFGDRLGERAQEILDNVPDDEEKAREYIFSTPEWKNASNEQKKKWLDAWYGVGGRGKGVDRARSAEAYIDIAGNSEDDFRWQNDITATYQNKYNDAGLAEAGISKGAWVDILEACKDSNHKWNEESLKNQDTINSAKKTKAGILSVEGLTPEQRVEAYNVIRGKRTGFGWNDWDGVSSGGGYYRRRWRRWHRWHRYGSGKKKEKPYVAPKIKQSLYKASSSNSHYKSLASSLQTRSGSTALPTTTTKIQPPKVKFKKYEV